jgi:hypothetical protein
MLEDTEPPPAITLTSEEATLPYLRVSLLRLLKSRSAHTTWRGRPVRPVRRLHSQPSRPGKPTIDTRAGTHRAISSVVAQMRTSKLSLRAYLDAISTADSGSAYAAAGRRTCRGTSRVWVRRILCGSSMAV